MLFNCSSSLMPSNWRPQIDHCVDHCDYGDLSTTGAITTTATTIAPQDYDDHDHGRITTRALPSARLRPQSTSRRQLRLRPRGQHNHKHDDGGDQDDILTRQDRYIDKMRENTTTRITSTRRQLQRPRQTYGKRWKPQLWRILDHDDHDGLDNSDAKKKNNKIKKNRNQITFFG